MPDRPIRVGLFVTCLVDLYRPSVGFAAVKLLEAAGCAVTVPEAQSCCGPPGHNSGDRASALFPDDPPMLAEPEALAAKTYELVSFLADVMKFAGLAARFDGVATYH